MYSTIMYSYSSLNTHFTVASAVVLHQINHEMTVHMSETIQKDYGVNLNIKYHKDITRAWDKCQEEVREYTRAVTATTIVTSHFL